MRLIIVCAIILPLMNVEAASMELVCNGESRATIVLAAESTCAASMAARELQQHVRLITGAELPIVPGFAVAPELSGSCSPVSGATGGGH